VRVTGAWARNSGASATTSMLSLEVGNSRKNASTICNGGAVFSWNGWPI
jgi:hypothetical protein